MGVVTEGTRPDAQDRADALARARKILHDRHDPQAAQEAADDYLRQAEAAAERLRMTPEELAEAREAPAPLSAIARFISRYVDAPATYIDAMVLIAAQTYCLDELVTTMRVLFTGKEPKCGKTEAMMILAALCEDAEDADGTRDSLRSLLGARATAGIQHASTLYWDDISKVFGEGGTRGQGHPVYPVIVKGYKKRAHQSRSVDRTSQHYSIYGTFLMSGLGTAVPHDVVSRCIVFNMTKGDPTRYEYFDERDARPKAENYALVLGRWVRAHADEIKTFRARGIHPELEGRLKEIWEGCFAVAWVAGQEWLNRCMAAFTELALDESELLPLDPEQKILRDCATVAASKAERVPLPSGDRLFAGGLMLADELIRLDEPLYADATLLGLAKDISHALAAYDISSRQVNRVRGYWADEIIAAWEKVAPPDMMDVRVPGEFNPFAVSDDDADDYSYDPGEHGCTDCPDVPAGSTDARMHGTFPGRPELLPGTPPAFATSTDGETEIVDAELVDD